MMRYRRYILTVVTQYIISDTVAVNNLLVSILNSVLPRYVLTIK